MPRIRWRRAESGAFDKRSHWSGHVTPGRSDQAALEAAGPAYTVTAARDEWIKTLRMAANATLAIVGTRNHHTVFKARGGSGKGDGVLAGVIAVGDYARLAVGGVVDNTGVIALDSTVNFPSHGGETALVLKRDTTLTGGGNITLSDRRGNETRGAGVTLTNVDNTGAGYVGWPSAFSGRPGLSIVNEAAGVIDSTGRQGLQIAGALAGGGSLVNNGLIESRAGVMGITNMRVSGAGTILSAGRGAWVDLASCSLAGQTLVVGAGGYIDLQKTGGEVASLSIGAGGMVNLADAGYGLTVAGAVVNDGTLYATADFKVEGAVSGSGGIIVQSGTLDFTGSFVRTSPSDPTPVLGRSCSWHIPRPTRDGSPTSPRAMRWICATSPSWDPARPAVRASRACSPSATGPTPPGSPSTATTPGRTSSRPATATAERRLSWVRTRRPGRPTLS